MSEDNGMREAVMHLLELDVEGYSRDDDEERLLVAMLTADPKRYINDVGHDVGIESRRAIDLAEMWEAQGWWVSENPAQPWIGRLTMLGAWAAYAAARGSHE